MQSRTALILVASILFLVACSESVPQGVIPADKMVDVLYDYHLAKGFDQPHQGIQIPETAVLNACYKKYGIDEAKFDSSMSWYSRHIDLLNDIYAQVLDRYESDGKKLGNPMLFNTPVNKEITGDTMHIWNGPRLALLLNQQFCNRLDFHMDADTAYHMHDLFQLVFQPHFLMMTAEGFSGVSDVSQFELIAGMVIKYANDSVSAISQAVFNPEHTVVQLKADSAYAIKSVSGFITLPSRKSTPVLIDGLSLLKFHTRAEEPKPAAPVQPVNDSVARPHKSDSVPTHRLSPQEIRSSKKVNRKVFIRKR